MDSKNRRKTSGSSGDAVSTVCSRLYSMDKERSDKVRSQLGMRKLDKRIRERKQKLAGAFTYDAIRKCSKANVTLST